MTRFKKALFIFVAVALALGGALTFYGNFIAKPPATAATPRIPEPKEAPVSLLIRNSGTLILTGTNYEQFGSAAGARVFVLHGYWEQRGYEFIRKDGDLKLSEKVSGIIDIRRRN